MDTAPPILPPTNDWIFKLLFGDERHKNNTVALLKSFLDLPEEEFDVSFMDTALKPESEEEKAGIVDVKIKTRSGTIIDVEIQVNPFPNLEKRISFYKSKLIVEQIGEGERYDVIRRVICVCILDHPFFRKETEYLNRFRYYNPETGLCFEGMPEEIYMIELTKVPEESDGRAAWDWMRFLRGKGKEEFEMIAERNNEVREAVNTLYRLSEDPEVRARMEYREKARRDQATLLYAAVQEGEARGEARGKALGEAQSRAEIARNMRNLGLPLEMIEKVVGLGPEVIKQL
ncbi:MAG: Rpn family recombination-promoting nuclease/putative transposase [Spirochaetaceae bacterium]|jgi:predicted transposase/invertase (TIGR01784 family)|nr:Rpn family recombination-promoting nuclease/putative transposase [Spirochaetaceae bacterium]